jgi:hypothetical protein
MITRVLHMTLLLLLLMMLLLLMLLLLMMLLFLEQIFQGIQGDKTSHARTPCTLLRTVLQNMIAAVRRANN